MRELSLVELDMVVGGYFDTGAYESSATANGDGSYGLTVSSDDLSANGGQAAASGWEIEVTGTYGPNPSISIKAKKSC